MDIESSEMKKTWTCCFWVTSGEEADAEPVAHEVPVTEEEYEILSALRKAQSGEDGDDDETLSQYEGMFVDDIPELSFFVERVDAIEEEYIDRGAWSEGYSYGSVQ